MANSQKEKVLFVEWLKSDGNSFVITDVYTSNSIRLVSKFAYGVKRNTFLFGSNTAYVPIIVQSSGRVDTRYVNVSIRNIGTADDNIHTIDYNDDDRNIIYDGNVVANIDKDMPYSRAIGIFNDTSAYDPVLCSDCKIYYVQLYENGELIRDYKPAVINGVPCLYDIINKTPLYNVGTGEFSYGNPI